MQWETATPVGFPVCACPTAVIAFCPSAIVRHVHSASGDPPASASCTGVLGSIGNSGGGGGLTAAALQKLSEEKSFLIPLTGRCPASGGVTGPLWVT